jgi:hypothetical protein
MRNLHRSRSRENPSVSGSPIIAMLPREDNAADKRQTSCRLSDPVGNSCPIGGWLILRERQRAVTRIAQGLAFSFGQVVSGSWTGVHAATDALGTSRGAVGRMVLYGGAVIWSQCDQARGGYLPILLDS